jgi:hypothetical protein
LVSFLFWQPQVVRSIAPAIQSVLALRAEPNRLLEASHILVTSFIVGQSIQRAVVAFDLRLVGWAMGVDKSVLDTQSCRVQTQQTWEGIVRLPLTECRIIS